MKWTYYPPNPFIPMLSHRSYYKIDVYGLNNPQTQAIGKTRKEMMKKRRQIEKEMRIIK